MEASNQQNESNEKRTTPIRMKDIYTKPNSDNLFSSDTKIKPTPKIETIPDQDASSDDKVEFTPRKDVEFAFTCLSNWESSYDGVHRIWELIKNEPDIDLNDYFDSLDFTQKCYLISGLNATMHEEKMEVLAPIINELDLRTMNESKSDRVQREAQRIGEKMSELIKTETPKINRTKNANTEDLLISPSPSTSSKTSTTLRSIRPSSNVLNDSSVSSKMSTKTPGKLPTKTITKTPNTKASISSNTSFSVKSSSSKTPTVISRNASSGSNKAFALPDKSKKPTMKSVTPTNNNKNQETNSSIYQNNSLYKNRLLRSMEHDNDISSQASSSSRLRMASKNSDQAHRPKYLNGKI